MARSTGVSILELNDVKATYGPYKALNGLSVRLDAGESLAVLGRNGVGKSTFARVISGLVPVSDGELRIFDQRVRRASPSRLARLGVVHLPEGVGLFSGLSVEENLRLRVGGRTRHERHERLTRALDSIGPLRDRRRSKAGELSGGQQRRVAISGAIAAEPRLLVADEPALGLSPTAADDVYGALDELRSTDSAIIIIETKLGRVEAMCPRAIVMNTGVAVFDGDIDEARHVLATLLPTGETSVPVSFDFGPADGIDRSSDLFDAPRRRLMRRRARS
jgi:branched-chain amino acid transport system ATP-binding protein